MHGRTSRDGQALGSHRLGVVFLERYSAKAPCGRCSRGLDLPARMCTQNTVINQPHAKIALNLAAPEADSLARTAVRPTCPVHSGLIGSGPR